MTVKLSIPAEGCAVIIDLLVPDLLEAKLSRRHKFRYFLFATGLSKKPVLQDQAEWMKLREEVEKETLVVGFTSHGKCKIEREVLSMGTRSNCRA